MWPHGFPACARSVLRSFNRSLSVPQVPSVARKTVREEDLQEVLVIAGERAEEDLDEMATGFGPVAVSVYVGMLSQSRAEFLIKRCQRHAEYLSWSPRWLHRQRSRRRWGADGGEMTGGHQVMSRTVRGKDLCSRIGVTSHSSKNNFLDCWTVFCSVCGWRQEPCDVLYGGMWQANQRQAFKRQMLRQVFYESAHLCHVGVKTN